MDEKDCGKTTKFEGGLLKNGVLALFKRDSLIVQYCPYSKEAPCADTCPHFGTPEEVLYTERILNEETQLPTYSQRGSGFFTLKICQGTVIKLGRKI